MSDRRLFSPITIRHSRIKNRIVLAPMGTRTNLLDGTLTNRCETYLEERLRGEVGLLIPEFAGVRAGYVWTPSLGVHSDRLIPALSRLADAAHSYGARCLTQIALHGGRAPSAVTGNPCIAPSAVRSPLYKEIPVALTDHEIQGLIDDWVRAAQRTLRAGFDGVEVHGGHGYLIAEFMSPHTNHRTDEWGGDFDRCMAFPRAIVRRIREACGDDFIIGFKYSAHEHVENGVDEESALEIARAMQEAGVDYLHVSSTSSTIAGHTYCRYPSVPSMYDPEAPLEPLARTVKSVAEVPVIAAGGIADPDDAERLLADGSADMVAVGRAYFADAHWGLKAKRGREIRPCIKCNVCHSRVIEGKEIVCTVNAGLLREYRDLTSGRAAEPRGVLVVGAGPGGMETALEADRRGHRVTLVEKTDMVGGALRLAGIPPHKHRIRRLVQYYENRLAQSGIRLMTNTSADRRILRAITKDEDYDVVVLATGGVPVVPDIPGVEASNVFLAHDVLDDPGSSKLGDGLVIIGAGKVGLETALLFSSDGRSVTVLDAISEEQILLDEHPTNRISLLHLLDEAGVRLITDCRIDAIEGNCLKVSARNDERQSLAADSVVIAAGYRAESPLHRQMEEDGAQVELYSIGDCRSVEGCYQAIHDGYFLGSYVL